jgi:hypothetical protein
MVRFEKTSTWNLKIKFYYQLAISRPIKDIPDDFLLVFLTVDNQFLQKSKIDQRWRGSFAFFFFVKFFGVFLEHIYEKNCPYARPSIPSFRHLSTYLLTYGALQPISG